jgi:hypothetical protein
MQHVLATAPFRTGNPRHDGHCRCFLLPKWGCACECNESRGFFTHDRTDLVRYIIDVEHDYDHYDYYDHYDDNDNHYPASSVLGRPRPLQHPAAG